MNKVFTENGWKDYIYWQTEDRKTLKKINGLIADICRNGNEGIGKPEPLTGNPRFNNTAARPLMLIPPMPMK